MFRLLIGSAAACLVLVATAGAAEVKFRKVASKAGKFTVEMPGTPKEATQTTRSGAKFYQFETRPDVTKVYRVQYVDLNSKETDAQKVLKLFRDGFRKGATLVGDKEITLGARKVPGREYRLEAQKGVHVRERLYRSGARIYILHVVALNKDYLGSKDADRFFDSFKVD